MIVTLKVHGRAVEQAVCFKTALLRPRVEWERSLWILACVDVNFFRHARTVDCKNILRLQVFKQDLRHVCSCAGRAGGPWTSFKALAAGGEKHNQAAAALTWLSSHWFWISNMIGPWLRALHGCSVYNPNHGPLVWAPNLESLYTHYKTISIYR